MKTLTALLVLFPSIAWAGCQSVTVNGVPKMLCDTYSTPSYTYETPSYSDPNYSSEPSSMLVQPLQPVPPLGLSQPYQGLNPEPKLDAYGNQRLNYQ